MVQKNAAGADGKYVGPIPTAIARPMEQSTPIPAVFPWAMQWSDSASSQIDWIFLADNATAAATRRMTAYTFNRLTGAFAWKGFITITFPTATVFTIRGLRMTYDLYTAGTVAVSGTAVTGTGSTWQTPAADIAKPCVGNRIGFGSTDPSQITTWYEISAIGSNTGITLSASAGTITAGTPYVIEDLRAIMITTNATITNGGLMVIKGLNFDQFSSIGGTVPAATTVDNIRAAYWLADASTVTNTVSFGAGLIAATAYNSQYIYVLDTLANPVVFKYNVRAALTLTSGKDTTSLAYKTGSGGVLTGAPAQTNNGRIANVSHGPHSGVDALYFTTATRIYAAPLSGITIGSTTWLSGGSAATEVPPGGVTTFAASGALSSLEYASAIDKWIVTTLATTTPFRSYVTQYRTDAGQWDRVFGCDIRQIDQSSADSSTVPVPSMVGGQYTVWSEAGLLYIATFGTTAITNRLYAVPLGGDWEYADTTGCFIITPKMTCTDIRSYVSAMINEIRVAGGDTGINLGINPEPFRVKYRTSGISDNSGLWTLLDDNGSLSGISGTTDIQLKFEFRTIGLTQMPARIQNWAVLYDDVMTDSHYQFSMNLSSASAKQFAWRHSTAFGGTVPTLYIRLYDADTGSLLLTDDTVASANGVFETSTNDGSSWGTYSSADKANTTTYIRYTPTSIADSIKVRATIGLS